MWVLARSIKHHVFLDSKAFHQREAPTLNWRCEWLRAPFLCKCGCQERKIMWDVREGYTVGAEKTAWEALLEMKKHDIKAHELDEGGHQSGRSCRVGSCLEMANAFRLLPTSVKTCAWVL